MEYVLLYNEQRFIGNKICCSYFSIYIYRKSQENPQKRKSKMQTVLRRYSVTLFLFCMEIAVFDWLRVLPPLRRVHLLMCFRDRLFNLKGGGLGFFLKKIFWIWFWLKKNILNQMCQEKNILTENVKKKIFWSKENLHRKFCCYWIKYFVVTTWKNK